MSSKKFIIKESTRKRCRVFPIDSFDRRQFTPISMELFHFLYEAPAIDFSIFIRVDEEMVEYIKATELSKELLKHIWLASIKDDAEVEICVQSADHAKFTRVIDSVRDLKIKRLIEREPALDTKTLISFVNLSGASQMILRGGINEDATRKVAAAASFMVSNLMDNNFAIATLSRMIQIDPSLYDHSAAVAMFSGIMGKQAYQGKLSQKNAETLAQCGLYHDAGKACIPHAVLNKPGAFTPEEFEIMKSHAILGYKVISKSINEGASIEKIVAEVALQHHERFSGKGYPYGKKGRLEENTENGIHPFARIVAIADSYSALLMERVYKPALPAEEALRLLEINSLEHFDPVFYNPFVAALKKSLNLYEEKKQSLVGNIYVVEKGDNVAQKIIAKKQSKSHKEDESLSKLSLDVHIHDEDCDHQPHGEKKLGA